MKVLNINNTCVLIFYDQSGIWTQDKVLIDGEEGFRFSDKKDVSYGGKFDFQGNN